LRWYATLPNGNEIERADGTPFKDGHELIKPKSRTFIPARVKDNPDLRNTGYISTLQALPQPVRSQVLHGDFTAGIQDDPWQVIPTAWVEASMALWNDAQCRHQPLDCVAVDVARGGSAKTILARRRRNWIDRLEKHPGSSTPNGPKVVSLIVNALKENPNAVVNIDVIGVGAAVYDACAGIRGMRVYGVNFAERVDATDPSGRLRFVNIRAFAYGSVRECLDPNRPLAERLILPPDPELLADLTAPKWELGVSGIKVEPKEKIVERLGRSPDCGDAVALAALLPSVAMVTGPARLRS
jgi:hypothetical protein